jgi:hypothetical protein
MLFPATPEEPAKIPDVWTFLSDRATMPLLPDQARRPIRGMVFRWSWWQIWPLNLAVYGSIANEHPRTLPEAGFNPDLHCFHSDQF